jgi:hypothetical protein
VVAGAIHARRRWWIGVAVLAAVVIAGAIVVIAIPGHAGGPVPPQRITGLQQGPGGPPGTNMVFTSTGSWIGKVDGQWYHIYAGAKATPGTGQTVRSELLIYLGPKHINTTEREHQIGTAIPPEGGTRPLKITAASGSLLTIQTATGATLKFNVATQAFES